MKNSAISLSSSPGWLVVSQGGSVGVGRYDKAMNEGSEVRRGGSVKST